MCNQSLTLHTACRIQDLHNVCLNPTNYKIIILIILIFWIRFWCNKLNKFWIKFQLINTAKIWGINISCIQKQPAFFLDKSHALGQSWNVIKQTVSEKFYPMDRYQFTWGLGEASSPYISNYLDFESRREK